MAKDVRRWVWTGVALLLAACDDTAVGQPTASTGDPAVDVVDTSNPGLVDAADDVSPDKLACIGTALDPGMAAFDDQCAFLTPCLHAGQCFCGDGCPANKVKCDPQYCADPHPTCYCGDACDASVTKCPNYVCTDTPPGSCQVHDDCVYNNQKPPAWCGCQTMPDRCSCGADCAPNVPKCDAKVCKAYPQKGCTPNSAAYTNCYCEVCGLHASKAHCWFLHCPGTQP